MLVRLKIIGRHKALGIENGCLCWDHESLVFIGHSSFWTGGSVAVGRMKWREGKLVFVMA